MDPCSLVHPPFTPTVIENGNSGRKGTHREYCDLGEILEQPGDQKFLVALEGCGVGGCIAAVVNVRNLGKEGDSRNHLSLGEMPANFFLQMPTGADGLKPGGGVNGCPSNATV